MPRRTARTIRIGAVEVAPDLVFLNIKKFFCFELLEGYFITEVSRWTARTIQICSVEVSPDLVLLNIRKVNFRGFIGR